MQHTSLGVAQDTRSQERRETQNLCGEHGGFCFGFGFSLLFFCVCGFVLHLRFELVFQ